MNIRVHGHLHVEHVYLDNPPLVLTLYADAQLHASLASRPPDDAQLAVTQPLSLLADSLRLLNRQVGL